MLNNGGEHLNKRLSNLEKMVTKIEVLKNPIPILTTKDFSKSLSVRNPGGVIYDEKILLLLTIRNNDKKSRIYIANNQNKDGKTFRIKKNPFINTDPDSKMATEDPRVIYDPISGSYLITFTAFKGVENKVNTTRIGLIKTKDFENYEDRRIILDKFKNNKNCVIYPDQKNKVYWIYHRPFKWGPEKDFPSVKLARSKDLRRFTDEGTFLDPRPGEWDGVRVGLNTPFIRIEHPNYGECLFALYHGVEDKTKNIYKLGYVIVDPIHPKKILERSKKPLISPKEDWEIGQGKYRAEVKSVIFGQVLIPISEHVLRLYYGGADMQVGFADLTLAPKILDKPYELAKTA